MGFSQLMQGKRQYLHNVFPVHSSPGTSYAPEVAGIVQQGLPAKQLNDNVIRMREEGPGKATGCKTRHSGHKA